MHCSAQRGFLTLGSCESPMASMCTSCGQPFCGAHLSAGSGFTKCVTCAMTDPTNEPEEAEYDSEWSHRYRDSYYRDSGYHGVSSTTTHDTYDAHDAAGFDNTGEGELDEGDEGGGTGAFGES